MISLHWVQQNSHIKYVRSNCSSTGTVLQLVLELVSLYLMSSVSLFNYIFILYSETWSCSLPMIFSLTIKKMIWIDMLRIETSVTSFFSFVLWFLQQLMVAAVGLKPRPSEWYVCTLSIADKITFAMVETTESFAQRSTPEQKYVPYKYIVCICTCISTLDHHINWPQMELEQEQLILFLQDFLYDFGALLYEFVLICFFLAEWLILYSLRATWA